MKKLKLNLYSKQLKETQLEEAFNYPNLLSHLKHYSDYIDDPRCQQEAETLQTAIEAYKRKYDAIADQLAHSPAGKAESSEDNIVGYIPNQPGRVVKYNKLTRDFIVYNPRTFLTITLHKKTLQQYTNIKNRDFMAELPENDLPEEE